MSEYITLIGSENVQRAGGAIQSAASDILRAANTISTSLYQHQQFLEEFLQQFEDILNKPMIKSVILERK